MLWTPLENPGSVAGTALERICESAREAIASRGRFSIVLAGGRTPELTYALLAKEDNDWQNWHIYFGDERCLASGHPERNSCMAARTLTGKVPIPDHHIHPISAELGAETAARLYSEEIRCALPFDLVLLGMGEDGHTASLFPGFSYPDRSLVIPVHNAPKPPTDRVSLTPSSLGNCRQLLILITGAGKKDAVARWRKGESLPVNRIKTAGHGEILIDRGARG